MADPHHLSILRLGSEAWNEWRKENPRIVPDLSGSYLKDVRLRRANLTGCNLRLTYFGGANFSGSDLSGADLSETYLRNGYFAKAKLENTKLNGADLRRADFNGAWMVGADLASSYLEGASLTGANLERSTLENADLRLVVAADTNFRNANLTGCQVYGISAWNVALDGAQQCNLAITPPQENLVTADNLRIAQFLYLLLNDRMIRDVIETVGKKVILILGRFGEDRKPVLEAIRNELRRVGTIPVLFDFSGPANRDITETVSTLAHLSRAIIADLTDARSVPQELMAVIPNLPSVPVQPIIATSDVQYGMFEHFRRYPWVRDTFRYSDSNELLEWLKTNLAEFAGVRS